MTEKLPDESDIIVEVTTDRTSIQKARAMKRSRGRSRRYKIDAERFLAHLEGVRFDFPDTIGFLNAEREKLIPELRAMVSKGREHHPGERASAAVLLHYYGDPRGRDSLIELIRDDSSEEALAAVLGELGRNHLLARSVLDELELKQTLFRYMEHSNFEVRRAAMAACVPAYPGESFGPVVAESLTQLAKAEPRVLGESWTMRLLHHLARQKDPRESSPALELLTDLARSTAPGTQQSAVQTLARYGNASTLEVLEAVLESDAQAFTRGVCLIAIARIRGRDADGLLREKLADRDLRGWAAEGLGKIYSESGDEILVRDLMLAALDEKDYLQRERIAEALLRVGGSLALRAVMGLVEGMGTHMSTKILWRLAGIDRQQALEKCRLAGWLVDFEDVPTSEGEDYLALDEVGEIRRFWIDLHRQGAVLGFDAETGYPPQHDRLLHEFARHSRGLLRLESVHQSGTPEGKEHDQPAYPLQCLIGGRLYRATARYAGDYYDTKAVLALLHRALEEEGHEERFVELNIGGQVANYVFGRPAEVERIMGELYIPLADRVDAWRESIRDLLAHIEDVGDYVENGLAFHAFLPTDQGADPLFVQLDEALSSLGFEAVLLKHDMRERTYQLGEREGESLSLTIQLDVQPGWTELWLQPIEERAFRAHGPQRIVQILQTLCTSLPVVLGRTCTTDDFGRIRPAELVGGVDWLDWWQYFNRPLAERLGLARHLKKRGLTYGLHWTRTDKDAYTLQIGKDPFRNIPKARVSAGRRLNMNLRRLPPERRAVEDKEAGNRLHPPEAEPWDDLDALATVRAEGGRHESVLQELERALEAEVVPPEHRKSLRRSMPFIEVGLFEAAKSSGPLAELSAAVQQTIEDRNWRELQKRAAGSLKALAVWGSEILQPTLFSLGDLKSLECFLNLYCDSPLDTGILDRMRVWYGLYEEPAALRGTVRVLARERDKVGRPMRYEDAIVHGSMKFMAALAVEDNAKLSELFLTCMLSHSDRLPMLKSFLEWPDFDSILFFLETDHKTKTCPCEHCETLREAYDWT